MTQPSTDFFYSRLPLNEIPLTDLLSEDHLFFKIPSDWFVVITDVKDSTPAVYRGLHETINLVATGCIVAVLNIAYKQNLTVPFFFGGDGATFLLPPSILAAAMQALNKHRDNTLSNFELDLRVGNVSVEEVYEKTHELKITKLKTSETFFIPVLLGDGLLYAEQKIKGPDYVFSLFHRDENELDLSGMQCKWDRIKPPENNYEVVSLLVLARENIRQSHAFKLVMDEVDRIYGAPQTRRPITVSKLKMNPTFAKLALEMKARMGRFDFLYLCRSWGMVFLAPLYFRTKKGKNYLNSLVNMSDTLVVDGKINTVITGTDAQRQELESALNKLETDGIIVYGLYVSNESVMSCYVRNMNDNHIHFIDGAEGGYTRAAGVIKKKLLSLEQLPR
jgi:hypothetical protein